MWNLLKQTEEVMQEYSKTWDDVLFIRGENYNISKEKFIRVADQDFPDEFESDGWDVERFAVARDLTIVGDGWWLEREDKDGEHGPGEEEWCSWIYREIPKKAKIGFVIEKMVVRSDGWDTLADMN